MFASICPGPGLCPGLSPPEGAERRRRYVLVWHLVRGAACRVTGTRAYPALHLRRFSSRAALPGNRTDELSLRPDPGALTCATFHPVHVQPSKAAPVLRRARAVIRDDPEPCVAWTQNPGATPCSANGAPPVGALSEQGRRDDRRGKGDVNFNVEFARSINIRGEGVDGAALPRKLMATGLSYGFGAARRSDRLTI
jgi:hypothetical protein